MATIIDGKVLARKVIQKVQIEVKDILDQHNVKPGLAIVQVGSREDSNVYVRTKIKNAQKLGMNAKHVSLPNTVTEAEVLSQIRALNNDPTFHGIIVQLPLDSCNPIDSALCTNAVLPEKDIDGINTVNAGKLSRGELGDCFTPCTPKGCLELIKESGMEVKGQNAVVLGRSKIVGSPMANLLTWNHATVTICHSRTRDLPSAVRSADILVAAVGVANMVKRDWVKPGAVVIDCGITAVPDASKKSGQRLVGDVDYNDCKDVAGWITPVPGGVGPMTVAMLMQNTVEGCKRSLSSGSTRMQQAGLNPIGALRLIHRFAKVRF